MSATIDSTPAADGFRMPGEFEPHERLLDGLAGAARQLAPGRGAGAGGLRRGGGGDRRLRAGDDGAPPRPSSSAAARCCRRRSASSSSSSDDAWMRDTGPTFVVDGAGGRRGVDWHFNAWGGIYSPWDRDERVAAAGPRDRGRRPLPGAAGARGRLDPRRRRGHGADDGRVPAQPQPQPGAAPGADRAGAARLPRGREGGLARARRLRGRDRRARRQPRLLRPARRRPADLDARTRRTPSTRSPATRWSGWKRRPTPAAAPSR